MIELLGKNLKKYLNFSLSFVYPLKCFICQEEIEPSLPAGLCLACLNKLEKYPPLSSEVPLEDTFYFKRVWAACRYEGTAKEAVHLLKYKGKLILINQLSEIMIKYALENMPISEIDFIIPVPLHRLRLKEREFNQSEIFAAKLAKRFAITLMKNNLIRIRPTLPQTNLSKEERFKNVNNAFRLRSNEPLKEKNILLVDDVFTTGSTADCCAKVLKKEGKVKEVNVFALAKG